MSNMSDTIDTDASTSAANIDRIDDLMRVERWLATRNPGTILLTYHGLGGPIPGSYEQVHVEAAGSAWLRAWRRGRGMANDRYWLEDAAGVRLATIEGVVRHLLPDPDESW